MKMIVQLIHNPTNEQLKQLHKQYISGSQVNEILNRPWDNLRMLFDEPKLDDPYAHIADRDIALARGKLMESYIFEMAKQAFPNELQDMQTDKHTYHIQDTPFAFNIDGYIGKDINNVEAVVEIKTTRERDALKMLDKGWIDQMKFYCMCLNTTKAYLIGLYASDLQLSTFEFSRAELDELKQQLLEYNQTKIKVLKSKDFTCLDHLRNAHQKETLPRFEIEADDNQRLSVFEEMSQKVVLEKQLKKDIEAFKNSMKQIYGTSIVHWTNPNDGAKWCVESVTMKSSSINWEQVVSDIIQHYQLINTQAISKIIERNTTFNKPSIKTTIKPYKEK